MDISRRRFLAMCRCRRQRAVGGRSAGLGVRSGDHRQSAGRLSESRLGKDLSRSVPLRRHVHLDLCSERHAHVPPAGVCAQRRDDPQRTELRPRPLRRPVRQQGDQGLESARLSERVHDAAAGLWSVSAEGSGAAPGLEAMGRRRLSVAVRQSRTCARSTSSTTAATTVTCACRGTKSSKYVADGLHAIAGTYSGDEGAARLHEGRLRTADDRQGRRCRHADDQDRLEPADPRPGRQVRHLSLRQPAGTARSSRPRRSGRTSARGARDWNEYTWRGDQAPGPSVRSWAADVRHGLQRHAVLQAGDPDRQEPDRKQDARIALAERVHGTRRRSWSTSRRNTTVRRPSPTTGSACGRGCRTWPCCWA